MSSQGEFTKCWKHGKDSAYTCGWVTSPDMIGDSIGQGGEKAAVCARSGDTKRTLLHH